jgi:class 3 adenylate cyclase
VGERTRQLVNGNGRFDNLPPVRLKGKAQPVAVFRARWGEDAPAERKDPAA